MLCSLCFSLFILLPLFYYYAISLFSNAKAVKLRSLITLQKCLCVCKVSGELKLEWVEEKERSRNTLTILQLWHSLKSDRKRQFWDCRRPEPCYNFSLLVPFDSLPDFLYELCDQCLYVMANLVVVQQSSSAASGTKWPLPTTIYTVAKEEKRENRQISSQKLRCKTGGWVRWPGKWGIWLAEKRKMSRKVARVNSDNSIMMVSQFCSSTKAEDTHTHKMQCVY